MAKIRLGVMVGDASGSLGSTVFSHNRYGPYVRNRGIPVTITTSAAQAAKARLTQCSQAWAGLTEAQRLAWTNWAAQNPIVDTLGDKQNLDGHAAYVQINSRLLAAGSSVLTSPALSVAPAPLTTLSSTFDIGAGTTAFTFTPTPIGANNKLWIQAAVVNNPSINYVKNLLRFCGVSAANQATGYDWQSLVETRLGALSAGQKVVLFVSVFSTTSGLLSAPQRVEGTIVST